MNECNDLMREAWEVRRNFEPVIHFSAPGAKHYYNRYYSNHAYSFVNLSVTGKACACRCDHCKGRLLETMVAAPSPQEMRNVIDRLLNIGGQGILVSGGADSAGEVPLLPYIEVMKYAKNMGLKVLVHGGLIQPDTAAGLKEAGVDQVLLDVIGDENTIKRVYHLDRKPDDYFRSMIYCREAGLEVAPHVVIGLHYGQIRGERRALEMIREVDPETVVLVVLTPSPGTAMAELKPPPIDKVTELIAEARVMNPHTTLTLGCARPPGLYKRRLEIKAVDCGVNGIAYPDEATVWYAMNRGLEARFSEECCSLIARKEACVMNYN